MKKMNLKPSLGITAAILLAAHFAAVGCAHNSLEKQVDREISQESTIKTHADLRKEAGQLIESAQGITAKQKAELVALRDSVRTQLDGLWSQSLKLRSVLIKDLLASQYDADEVELIKRRMKEVEEKRLSVTLDAIEQANKILGRDASANRHLVEDFWQERGNRE